MPEGHSIRIYADRQTSLLRGKRVAVTSPQKRFEGARQVSGKVLRRVEGVGKHMFYHFSDRPRAEKLVHVHLGRLGRFRHHENEAPAPSPNCRMRLATKDHTIDLSGPTRCEIVTDQARRSVLARLGPDPLRADADPKKAWDRIRRSRKAVGALLLDQSIIAGLGNIFRAEILFRLGLSPLIKGTELTRKQFNAIWRESVAMMNLAVHHGRIITTCEKHIGKPLVKAKQAERFYVYHRSKCRICGGKIETAKMAGRTIYFCPTCQRGEDARTRD